MVEYLRRLVRVALVSTLGFGGGVALLVFIFIVVIKGEQNAALSALKAGLLLGIAFSLILTCVMVFLDLTARLFIAKGVTNTFWDLEQTREVVFNGSVKQVVAACRQALLAVPNVSSVSDDMTNLTAKALTGASWRSPGEEIHIEISQLDDAKCQVKCVSRCKSPKTIFDYGKNFENVETWHRRMDAELKSLAKPS
jgi:hypothetical protein